MEFCTECFRNEVELAKYINAKGIKKKDIEAIVYSQHNFLWYLLYWNTSKNA